MLRVMRYQPLLIAACAALTSLACGPQAPVKPASPTPQSSASPAAGPPGGGLSAQLSRVLPKDAKSMAVVSFAVFGPEAPAEGDAVEQAVQQAVAQPPAALAGVISSVKPWPELLYVPAPVDADLPLELSALAAEAGPAASALEGARSAVFVRYAGKALSDEAQVRAAAFAAAALATGPDRVVVDLGTRRAWTGANFAAWVAADDWIADQVTLSAEQGEDGSITFFTRGMARFGQPDLEAAGVPREQAKARFDAFQKLYAALRVHGPAKAGDTVGGVKLKRCTRPPEAIERSCVSM